MSRSYREAQLRKSKKAGKVFIDKINNEPELLTQDEDKNVKFVERFGNKRKYEAMKKVLKRISERKENNKIDY